MDRSNYQNVIRLAANDQQKQKVALLRISEEVPDPYYGGDDGFEKVFQMIDQACSIVANQIQDE
jgi:protein-tyrosine phosphatase